MASPQVGQFLDLIHNDPHLQAQVEGLDLMGLVALAEQQGLSIRAADLLRVQAEQILAMTDDELDALASGGVDDLFQTSDFEAYLKRT
jgi:predicted ribosomally synthesized peptide with nif11-like leader